MNLFIRFILLCIYALGTASAGVLRITPSASIPANGIVMGSGGTISQVKASSLAGTTTEKVTQLASQTGKAHVFTIPAGQFWRLDFFAFRVNAGTIGASNLKIVRYDQGFTTNATYSTVIADHSYSGSVVTTTNNDYLYFEFDPITLSGGVKGTT